MGFFGSYVCCVLLDMVSRLYFHRFGNQVNSFSLLSAVSAGVPATHLHTFVLEPDVTSNRGNRKETVLPWKPILCFSMSCSVVQMYTRRGKRSLFTAAKAAFHCTAAAWDVFGCSSGLLMGGCIINMFYRVFKVCSSHIYRCLITPL